MSGTQSFKDALLSVHQIVDDRNSTNFQKSTPPSTKDVGESTTGFKSGDPLDDSTYALMRIFYKDDTVSFKTRGNNSYWTLSNHPAINQVNSNGETLLTLAVAKGFDKCVECILNIPGLDVDKQIKDGLTALMIATHTGQLSLVRLLLSRKSNIMLEDSRGATALCVAISLNHREIINLLITKISPELMEYYVQTRIMLLIKPKTTSCQETTEFYREVLTHIIMEIRWNVKNGAKMLLRHFLFDGLATWAHRVKHQDHHDLLVIIWLSICIIYDKTINKVHLDLAEDFAMLQGPNLSLKILAGESCLEQSCTREFLAAAFLPLWASLQTKSGLQWLRNNIHSVNIHMQKLSFLIGRSYPFVCQWIDSDYIHFAKFKMAVECLSRNQEISEEINPCISFEQGEGLNPEVKQRKIRTNKEDIILYLARLLKCDSVNLETSPEESVFDQDQYGRDFPTLCSPTGIMSMICPPSCYADAVKRCLNHEATKNEYHPSTSDVDHIKVSNFHEKLPSTKNGVEYSMDSRKHSDVYLCRRSASLPDVTCNARKLLKRSSSYIALTGAEGDILGSKALTKSELQAFGTNDEPNFHDVDKRFSKVEDVLGQETISKITMKAENTEKKFDSSTSITESYSSSSQSSNSIIFPSTKSRYFRNHHISGERDPIIQSLRNILYLGQTYRKLVFDEKNIWMKTFRFFHDAIIDKLCMIIYPDTLQCFMIQQFVNCYAHQLDFDTDDIIINDSLRDLRMTRYVFHLIAQTGATLKGCSHRSTRKAPHLSSIKFHFSANARYKRDQYQEKQKVTDILKNRVSKSLVSERRLALIKVVSNVKQQKLRRKAKRDNINLMENRSIRTSTTSFLERNAERFRLKHADIVRYFAKKPFSKTQGSRGKRTCLWVRKHHTTSTTTRTLEWKDRLALVKRYLCKHLEGSELLTAARRHFIAIIFAEFKRSCMEWKMRCNSSGKEHNINESRLEFGTTKLNVFGYSCRPTPKLNDVEQMSIFLKTSFVRVPQNSRWIRLLVDLVRFVPRKVHGIHVTAMDIMFSSDSQYTFRERTFGTYLGLLSTGLPSTVRRLKSKPKGQGNCKVPVRLEGILQLRSVFLAQIYVIVPDIKSQCLYVVSEFFEFNLPAYLKETNQCQRQEEDDERRDGILLISQLIQAVAYLHGQKEPVLIGNLKPSNIMVTIDLRLKLADFYLFGERPLVFGIQPRQDIAVGMPCTSVSCWRPPELINAWNDADARSIYKKASDIHVVGMLCYYILSGGKHPFGDTDSRCQAGIIAECFSNWELSDSVYATDLLKRMMRRQPSRRIDINMVSRHPYFWSVFKRFHFLLTVGNGLHQVNSKHRKSLLISLKKRCIDITHWQNCIRPELMSKMPSERGYRSDCIGFLNFVADLAVHFDKLPKAIKFEVGRPEIYLHKLFPSVILSIYVVLIHHKVARHQMKLHLKHF